MKFKLGWLSFGFLIFYAFQHVTWGIGNHLNSGDNIFYFLKGKAGLYFPFHLLVWLLCALLAYSLFYLLFYRYKQKVGAILAYIFIGIPLMIGIRYVMEEVILFSITGKHNYSLNMLVPLRYFIDNIYFTIYYSAFGVVFFFIQLNNYQQKLQNQLLLQNRQAELAFLRSQINPHFLFNSLNNVYTLVYQSSDQALPAISKLSELLRYMLYEEEQKVALSKEVRYLQLYFDLQLMRYDFIPATKINISLPPDCNLRIAPLTLIPFVENAFKHGDLRDEHMPLTIDLHIIGENLSFGINNKIGQFNKDHTRGIGAENVRKRLALIYGNKHTLAIDETEKQYKVKLTIDLHE